MASHNNLSKAVPWAGDEALLGWVTREPGLETRPYWAGSPGSLGWGRGPTGLGHQGAWTGDEALLAWVVRS